MLIKQELQSDWFNHKKSTFSAILWYLFRKNKYCKSFCPLCKFYFRCQEDITMGFTGRHKSK